MSPTPTLNIYLFEGPISPRKWNKMMQKSTTFTTIFRVKKCYFHYDFACKKVPLSFRYAKKSIFPTSIMKMILSALNLMRKIGVCITSEENGESKLTSEENMYI
jgi:hypothetical protein